MNNWQVSQTLLDRDADSRGTKHHLNALSIVNPWNTHHAFGGMFEGRIDERPSVVGDRIHMGG